MNVFCNAKLDVQGQVVSDTAGTYVWVNAYTYQGTVGGQVVVGHIDDTSSTVDKVASGEAKSVSVFGNSGVVDADVTFAGEDCELHITINGISNFIWEVSRKSDHSVVWGGTAPYKYAGLYISDDQGHVVSLST